MVTRTLYARQQKRILFKNVAILSHLGFPVAQSVKNLPTMQRPPATKETWV